MEHVHKYEAFRDDVRPAMKSKLEEFEMFGYGSITEKELWGFLVNKKWKKPKEDARVYEIVADILAVQPGEYMNYATVEAFKLGSMNLSDEEERNELLK
ncbi:post-transcriptional regulator [Mesobacillus maritimus]|uniref:post-transcriptional regulator n=1 Tax=Mesobacillus maritimus TaxID=1643336 RepID=UPI00203C7C64|nr:post-transcriptional regulator [Mesobacillus maritimus]MCM3587700.1 post-transcriptional regulator [Mesobacillus maritimus]